jgi:hypothetical protein
MGILYNPQHELFAQSRASGMSQQEAHAKAGYSGTKVGGQQMDRRPYIRARVKELQTQAANKIELSRKDILDRIFQDWELARKLGQCASALKAGELMGKELYHMFIDRKEVGKPGDFDSKTEDELRQIVRDGLKDLGWEEETVNQPPSTPSIN